MEPQRALTCHQGMPMETSVCEPRRDFIGEQPLEIALKILHFLKLDDLCRASGVSRAWRERVSQYLPIKSKHDAIEEFLGKAIACSKTPKREIKFLKRECFPAEKHLPAQAIWRLCQGEHPLVLSRTIEAFSERLSLARCIDVKQRVEAGEAGAVPQELREFGRLVIARKIAAQVEKLFPKHAESGRIRALCNLLNLNTLNSHIIFGDLEAAIDVLATYPDCIAKDRTQNYIAVLIERRIISKGILGFHEWFQTMWGRIFASPNDSLLLWFCCVIECLVKHYRHHEAWEILKGNTAIPLSESLLSELGFSVLRSIVVSNSISFQDFLLLDEAIARAKQENMDFALEYIEMCMACAYLFSNEETRQVVRSFNLSEDARRIIEEAYRSPTVREREVANMLRAYYLLQKSRLGASEKGRDESLVAVRTILSSMDIFHLHDTLDTLLMIDTGMVAVLAMLLKRADQKYVVNSLIRTYRGNFDQYVYVPNEIFGRTSTRLSESTLREITPLLRAFTPSLAKEDSSEEYLNDLNCMLEFVASNLMFYDVNLSIDLVLQMLPGRQKDKTLLLHIDFMETHAIAFHDGSRIDRVPELISLLHEGEQDPLLFNRAVCFCVLGMFDKSQEILSMIAEREKALLILTIEMFKCLHGVSKNSEAVFKAIVDQKCRRHFLREVQQVKEALGKASGIKRKSQEDTPPEKRIMTRSVVKGMRENKSYTESN